MNLKRLSALTVALLIATVAGAQEIEELGGIPADEDRAVIEWADSLEYDPDEDTSTLSGNVVIAHQDIKLYCDRAVYNHEQESAVATGNPRVVNPETTITGEIIEAHFEDEVATIVGKVTVVTQRKQEKEAEQQEGTSEDGEPEKLEDYWEKKTTITCDKIVYEYAEDVKRATATGRVKAVQEDKTVYADRAVYEELKDLITLTGNVRVLTDKGDEFRSPKAVISVEEDWVRMEQVRGVGTRRPDEDEEASAEVPAAKEQPPPEQEQAAPEQPSPEGQEG